MTGLQLRDYQQEAVEANHRHLYQLGYTGTIDFLATGLGKTRVAIATCDQLFALSMNRILFVVSFRELVLQARSSFIDAFPQLEHDQFTIYNYPALGIVMGNIDQPSARIVFGTPQTLCTQEGVSHRLEEILKYGPIDLVIFDEAHFAVASSYMSLRTRLLEANPNTKFLGLTATPIRQDGLALTEMFDSIAITRNIKWGIDNGYLCKVQDPKVIETNIRFQQYGSIDDKARAIDVKNWCEIVLKGYLEQGEGRKGIFFMPSVKHSEEFAKYASENGVLTAHIDGEKTIDPEGNILSVNSRYKMFERYRPEGDIKLLTNYNVLIAGIDLPWTSVIGWSRPTDNEVLYTQGIGRGTRLFPDKEDLIILDYAVKDIGLITAANLLGFTQRETEDRIEDEEEVKPIEIEMPAFEKPKPDQEGDGIIVRVGTLFKQSKSAWYTDGEWSSLMCSKTDILVVLFPNYTLANRIQHGIDIGQQFILDHPDDTKAYEFYMRLRTAHTLFDNFTLWKLSGTIEDRDPKRGGEYVKWGSPPTRWVAHADSVELAFDYAAPVISEIADSSFENKNRSWRKRGVITQDQSAFLSNAGYATLPTGVGSRGIASQMITHHIAVSKLRPAVAFYTKSCGKYGDVTREL